MAAMFFGQYLLSQGVISREALIDAIELQRRSNLSLTELAVRRGYIDSRQEAAILARFRTGNAELADLCLDSGLLDRDRLDELEAVQRSDWVRIGAALVAGGHLTRDQVEQQLEAFRRLERESEQRLEADFRSCRDPEAVRTVVELAVFHLGRLTDAPIKLRRVTVNGGRLAGGRRRYAQRLVGDRDLHVALDLAPDTASVVARGLLGVVLEEDSEAAIDAVCECVNIIGGNACTRLEAAGCRLRPEPPFATLGDEPAQDSDQAVRAEVLAGDAEVDVRVFLK
jgi:hypothetical protein